VPSSSQYDSSLHCAIPCAICREANVCSANKALIASVVSFPAGKVTFLMCRWVVDGWGSCRRGGLVALDKCVRYIPFGNRV
jgi:hypothetical protein